MTSHQAFMRSRHSCFRDEPNRADTSASSASLNAEVTMIRSWGAHERVAVR